MGDGQLNAMTGKCTVTGCWLGASEPAAASLERVEQSERANAYGDTAIPIVA